MTSASSTVAPRARHGRGAPSSLFDRDEIEAQLERLRAETRGDEAAFRRGAVEAFAAALEAGRAEARRGLEGGGRGRTCARALSDLEDEIIRAIHDMAASLVRPGGSKAARLTILAVGGYGRGMLAPGSDIDLLFLIDDEKDAAGAKLIETILYVLWDLKQKVGHATRTIDECIRQARADMTIRTSVLEARLILGDAKQFETLRARFDKEIVAKTASEFVTAKLAERDARVKRAGESRYLVEPNIKEGKGGLRDLNTLFWIAKYVYRVRDPQRTGRSGPVLAARIRAVLALRGIPVAGALPPPFPHRPRRGAAELRRAAADRRAARLRRARRPGRRRALHEALFPRRQGRRRPDRDRLRRARGAAGQADAGVRPLPRPAAAAAAGARRRRRFQDRPRPHQRRRAPTRSSAIRSISSGSSGSPTARASPSIPTRRGSSPSR